jgi:hypothetical protein
MQGFKAVQVARKGPMKFVDAKTAGGKPVRFWIKQGWTDARRYCAIQFGLFAGPEGQTLDDEAFVDDVKKCVTSAKSAGATHALLVHMIDEKISNWVALTIDDVVRAYREQIDRWPKRARRTKSATLWFEEHRDAEDAECIKAVTRREIPLAKIAGGKPEISIEADNNGAKRVTAEVERRIKQGMFRELVGQRCGWKCAVTGTAIREILDAAHLKGRNWRRHNFPEDGILLRADLHRLLDAGLASIRRGKFHVDPQARMGEYALLDGKPLEIGSR